MDSLYTLKKYSLSIILLQWMMIWILATPTIHSSGAGKVSCLWTITLRRRHPTSTRLTVSSMTMCLVRVANMCWNAQRGLGCHQQKTETLFFFSHSLSLSFSFSLSLSFSLLFSLSLCLVSTRFFSNNTYIYIFTMLNTCMHIYIHTLTYRYVH